MYREKSKKHSQTQYLYDTLKKKVMQSQIQTAATNTVTQLQSIGGMTRAGTYNGGTRLSDKIKPGARRRKPINYTITNRNGVEQLHHHQRSGSVSQNSTDAIAMPPPQRSFGGTRIRLLWSHQAQHATYSSRIYPDAPCPASRYSQSFNCKSFSISIGHFSPQLLGRKSQSTRIVSTQQYKECWKCQQLWHGQLERLWHFCWH